jgi:hypothetical protein
MPSPGRSSSLWVAMVFPHLSRHGRACPGHPRLDPRAKEDVDARHKAGHDGKYR